ncbi:subunit 17 of mediator complex-domain-containing protein [Lophiotrema nucula]|uniref:Mediator of RNA polymerase II transcription subunit 17 n=1 Tax=Lophiotrema nucula TaxID=690887 RepID=A0A6A5Z8X7_9PLEO|nr:subunit 17 of mediator complex-domain-containing protein [Lophiotrema nucula]
MSASGPATDVALRPWPTSEKEALDRAELHNKVVQLASERGHLRLITEESLQEEIDTGKDAVEVAVMEGVEQQEEVKSTQTKQDRQKQVWEVRNSMWQLTEWAEHYASSALDLVALVLSRDPTKKLDSAFSPNFKQQLVPRGTFGLDKGIYSTPGQPVNQDKDKDKDEPTAEEKKAMIAAQGSRMIALDWSVDSILNAANEMKKEVRKENKYWEEILSVSRQGWPLQRLRKDARYSPFAVRYGFPEANPLFKSRGFAPLKMDDDGSIILDPTLALKPKTLRVRISDDGRISGTSRLPAQEDESGLAIDKSIQLAKDSLFEEELYHEMSMETRQLLSFGVEMRNTVINLLVSGSGFGARKVLIDCIPREDNLPSGEDHSQDWLAQNIADALRLLLSHEHRMRLLRRMQIPPPLSLQTRTHRQPPLLRALLAAFSHVNAVDSLHSHLRRLVKTLESAGLAISLEVSRETSWTRLTDIIEESNKPDMAAMDQLVDLFIKPLEGQATLSLPSFAFLKSVSSEKLTVTTRTFMAHPTFGTEFIVTLPTSLANVLHLSQDQKREIKFSPPDSTNDVTSYVDWIISLHLSHTLIKDTYGKRAAALDGEPTVAIQLKGPKALSKRCVSVSLNDSKLQVALEPSDFEKQHTWDGSHDDLSFLSQVKVLVD